MTTGVGVGVGVVPRTGVPEPPLKLDTAPGQQMESTALGVSLITCHLGCWLDAEKFLLCEGVVVWASATAHLAKCHLSTVCTVKWLGSESSVYSQGKSRCFIFSPSAPLRRRPSLPVRQFWLLSTSWVLLTSR